MKIDEGKRVKLRVKLETNDGDQLEESEVQYFQGAGTMLPGLEAEVEGLEAGATKQGTIPADRAFGSEQHRVERAIPRSEFPAEAELAPDSQFAAKGPDDQDVVLRVLESDDAEVKVQVLHPLADKDLHYDVKVLDVSDPTPPPIPKG